MKMYLSADYERQGEIREYADELRTTHHYVASRWHDLSPDIMGSQMLDFLRIRICDHFILFTIEKLGGGTWCDELNYALYLNKIVSIVGPQHWFNCLDKVITYDGWPEFLIWNTNL